MGLTSLALSLASGWTTFEGMTNFTKSPVLCFLITFGVQGIMLVSAWMIGEAINNWRADNLVMVNDEAAGLKPAEFNSGLSALFRISLLSLVFFFSMAISVFFSFDSLFSSIFSQEERQRAGEIRAQSEVGAVLTKLKERIEERKFEAVDTLLAAPGWQEYNQRLDSLSKIARSAPDLVEQQLLSKLRSEQAEIARHQETLAQAKGQRAALETRQQKIATRINRLKTDRPSLSAELDELRQKLNEKQREIDRTKAEALEEARGIGATGREGEGPKFRAIKEKQRRLTAERDVLNTEKNLSADRLEKLDSQISSLSRELELVNGEMAKIEGQASVARTFIEAQSKRQTETAAREFSATASIDSLDDARETFRTKPGQETFLNIQTNCTNLYSALAEVPKIAPDIKFISCEPGAETATLAGRIFTLQAAAANQQKSCVIGKTRRSTRIDTLLKLGKRCIQSSGLPEKDANEMRLILNRVDLNRDDKAKNFVVTLNAFRDGNWLAYLALGLAIAIDSLVFISGLIGARVAAYENTGSEGDMIDYGLGMSVDFTGREPEDIYTAKLFFRSVEGPSNIPGFQAVINRQNLSPDDLNYVNKVLTIAGDKVRQDAGNNNLFHVEKIFYKNLALKVFLWDRSNMEKKNRPVYKVGTNHRAANANANDNENKPPEFDISSFGQRAAGSIVNKNERKPTFRETGGPSAIEYKKSKEITKTENALITDQRESEQQEWQFEAHPPSGERKTTGRLSSFMDKIKGKAGLDETADAQPEPDETARNDKETQNS